MSSHYVLLLAAALAIATATDGSAAEGTAPTVQSLLGTLKGKPAHAACFVRTYDDTHLARHPHQNVRDMRAYIKATGDGSDSAYEIQVGVHFRDVRKRFDVVGSCTKSAENPSSLHCGVDCDGGSFGIRQKDADALLIDVPDGASLIDSRTPKARFGADDKLFRLDRAPISECRSFDQSGSDPL
eukprot:gene24146-25847_t